MNKKICWVTASYFLDVDLPIVPHLKKFFDIDWYIISTENNIESDENLIKSQSQCDFTIMEMPGAFYSASCYRFYKDFISNIKQNNYDWFYFDISDYFFLYPLIKKHLSINKVTIATHNVSIPKGARLAPLAKISMSYILRNFHNFQVFSKNQKNVLLLKNASADIFYSPLMLKDYGNIGCRKDSKMVRFLFFGNIVEYKRLDILLNAINILENRGINNFNVKICGYCKHRDWERKYKPLIHSQKVSCDIRRIPNELVSDYFNDSDYFVMPYQDIAQSGAMTVAFNYNVPIIASNLDTFKEFLHDKEDGYFFEAGNSYDLANVMETAINNSSSEYMRIKNNQKNMVDNTLSSEAILNNYINYISKKLDANISLK